MSLRKFLLTVVVAVAMMVLSNPAMASDDSWEKVNEKGEVTIGFCAAYPPFESRNEKTGEFEGFDVDLGKAIAEEMGVSAKFIDGEWQGLIGGLHKGDYDMLMTCMSKSEGRGKNVLFSDTYYELSDVIVVRSGDERINSEKDLKGKVVGAQNGSAAMQIMDSLEGLGDKKYYNYNPEAFLDLKNDRIDAVIVSMAYAVNQIKKDESYKVTGPVGDPAEIVAVMPMESVELQERVNDALKNVKSNGTWQKLVDKWLSVN
jgi:polar amino acid transport system substrate-binding protein